MHGLNKKENLDCNKIKFAKILFPSYPQHAQNIIRKEKRNTCIYRSNNNYFVNILQSIVYIHVQINKYKSLT